MFVSGTNVVVQSFRLLSKTMVMYRFLPLPLPLALAIALLCFTACNEDAITTCQSEGTSCVRFRNDAGGDLINARARLAGEEFTLLGDVASGETTDYVSFSNADWCNFLLEGSGANGGAITSGGWICAMPDPLGNGEFTVVLTLSQTLPPEATFLNAELIEE